MMLPDINVSYDYRVSGPVPLGFTTSVEDSDAFPLGVRIDGYFFFEPESQERGVNCDPRPDYDQDSHFSPAFGLLDGAGEDCEVAGLLPCDGATGRLALCSVTPSAAGGLVSCETGA